MGDRGWRLFFGRENEGSWVIERRWDLFKFLFLFWNNGERSDTLYEISTHYDFSFLSSFIYGLS